MALHTFDYKLARKRATATIFNHVAYHFVAGGFADDAIINEFATCFQCLNYFDGAVYGNTFFIRSNQ